MTTETILFLFTTVVILLSIILLSGTYLYLYFWDEKMVRLAKSSVTGTVVGLGLGTAIGWFMNDFKFKELNNQSVTDAAKDALTKTTDAIGDGLKQ